MTKIQITRLFQVLIVLLWAISQSCTKQVDPDLTGSKRHDIQSAAFQNNEQKENNWTPGLRTNIHKGGEVYGFQIINEDGRQPVLRIDTTNEKTQHILALYQENKHYKIIHIPDFKTRNRLVTERESLFANKDIQQTVFLGYDFDLYALSDFTDFIGKKVELHWGTLIANPSSENYEVDDLRAQLPSQPELWVGSKKYPVQGFHLIIASQNQKPRRFIASTINTPELHKILLKQPPLTTVYFEHVIIEEQEQFFHFPAAFSFQLGELQEFDLNIEPADIRDVARQSMENQGGTTNIIFQSTDLKSIIRQLMDLPEDKLRFANFDDNPVLDVSFESKKLSLKVGKDLIAKRLSSTFKLNIERHIPRPTYNLRVKDSRLLEKYLVVEKNKNGPQQTLNKTKDGQMVRFEKVSLETLARFIDSELDLLIINDTQMKDKAFKVELIYSSLADIRVSLKQMGLELVKNPAYVQVVVTKLY